MKEFPFVSVVIPTYNEELTIEKSIRSVLDQNYLGLYEIIVVDGCSDDRTHEIVAELIPLSQGKLRLIKNPQKIIPWAMNTGIKASKGQIIVRLDGHSFIDPDYLSNISAKLESAGVACVGPKMIMLPTDAIISKAIAIALSIPFGSGTSGFRYSDKEQYADTMNFGAYRRELFDEVGYFDTTLLSNEDYELHYRIRKAGHRILYAPSLKVYYFVRNSFLLLWQQYFRYGYWKSKMLKKWPCSIKLRHLAAPGFVVALLICLFLSIFSSEGKILFICFLFLYLTTAVIFIFKQFHKNQKGDSFIMLSMIIIVFLVMHMSWGIGFWAGFLKRK